MSSDRLIMSASPSLLDEELVSSAPLERDESDELMDKDDELLVWLSDGDA